jgi:histidinol-phosphate aminotransferase
MSVDPKLKLPNDEVRALARPEVVDLPSYDPWFDIVPVDGEDGRLLELSSNENPFGPSPAVAEVLSGLASQVGRYPDPSCRRLRAALSKHTGVGSDQIGIGNGAENLIELLCQTFLTPGDRVVTQAPCYGLHDIHPRAVGAVVEKVRMAADLGWDVPAWRAALARPAKLVMFSNPSNPVGCILDRDGFGEVLAATPRGALLVVDEAYGEYAAECPEFPDSLGELQAQSRPWIILRTFSKAYGLAGLRVGYALASDSRIVSWLNRVRSPYNVNHAAQETALAALGDPDHMRDGVRKVAELRTSLARRLKACGYNVAPSHACFLFVEVGSGSGVKVAERLRQRGIAVKPWREEGYTSFIRVTIGHQDENDRFLAALLEVSEPSLGPFRTEVA